MKCNDASIANWLQQLHTTLNRNDFRPYGAFRSALSLAAELFDKCPDLCPGLVLRRYRGRAALNTEESGA